jgi:ATP-dependent Clp protease ATP-binding subunit ClpA
MFERFTEPARHVVRQSQQEAADLGHRYLGTEHLLLGLLDPDSGTTADILGAAGLTRDGVRAEVARLVGPTGSRPLGEADAQALQAIGIDLDAVRAKVEANFGPGALEPPEQDPPAKRSRLRGWPNTGTPFTPRARKVLELSLREAIHRHDNHIGSEHLLLGLIREGDGLAAKVLTEAGVDLPDLRRRTLAALDQARLGQTG